MLYSEKMPIFTAKHPAQTVTVDWAAYARDMFETIFKDFQQAKDVHITGLLADLMNQTPVTEADFRALKAGDYVREIEKFLEGWSNGTVPCFAGADACIRPRVRLAVKTMNANQHSRCARTVQCSTGALIAARPRNASIDPYRRAIQSMRPNYSSFPSNIALVRVSPS